ncbi:hypothetical protein [Variovorax boronicumulans]|uniref:hypothetical protein n=1 Tax=Variovorax boronicumulans TaxID=436515 RepID=UPI0033961D88
MSQVIGQGVIEVAVDGMSTRESELYTLTRKDAPGASIKKFGALDRVAGIFI